MIGDTLEFLSRRTSRISLAARIRIGRTLGWLLGTVVRHRRGLVMSALTRSFPEKSRKELSVVADGVYRHLGLLIMECLSFPRQPPGVFQSLVDYHGVEHIEAALAEGRGVLILMGHIGNWELMGLAAARHLPRIHLIAKTQHHPGFDAFWRASRERMGIHMLPARDSYEDCLRVLDRGEAVFVPLDQNMRRPGVFVDFFGQQASTTPGLAYLAEQSRAPVAPAYCIRKPDGRHELHYLPALHPPADRCDGAIQAATQAYTKILEDIIRRHPEQWLWMHKRWRSRPARRATVVNHTSARERR